MAYRAVLFDLDGTLVHTAPEHRYQTVGQTLKDLGVTAPNHHIDKFWFEALREEAIKKYFRLEPSLFWETFRRHDTVEVRKQFTKPYDDVNFIPELKQRGYKIGIVTGAPSHIVNLEIGMLGEKNFDVVVIAQIPNGLKPKPHPDGLEKCLRLLGVDKTESIYVGNANEDVLAAQNAHVFDVLLVRGEYEFPDLTPSLRINSLYELRQVLGF